MSLFKVRRNVDPAEESAIENDRMKVADLEANLAYVAMMADIDIEPEESENMEVSDNESQ